MPKRRIDTLLAERGLAGSRTSAAESVRAGRVRIGRDGPIATKPGQLIAEEADLVRRSSRPRYVSRGGLKLENALDALAIDVAGWDCLDVGASTGGFTDCLLQRGAARVIALDVARGQLDWGLRNDARVTVIERANARSLELGRAAVRPAPGDDRRLLHLPGEGAAARRRPAWTPTGELLALVKPQFELGPERVGKGGVVRDAGGAPRRPARGGATRRADAGLAVRGFASSGLPGPKGNRETFIHCAPRRATASRDVEAAIRAVEP